MAPLNELAYLKLTITPDFVYFCRSQHSELRDVIIKSNASGIALDQQKVDQYIKAMSLSGSEKVKYVFSNDLKYKPSFYSNR